MDATILARSYAALLAEMGAHAKVLRKIHTDFAAVESSVAETFGALRNALNAREEEHTKAINGLRDTLEACMNAEPSDASNNVPLDCSRPVVEFHVSYDSLLAALRTLGTFTCVDLFAATTAITSSNSATSHAVVDEKIKAQTICE